MSGLRLPRSGEALWHEPGGTWWYMTLKLLDVEYNLAPRAHAAQADAAAARTASAPRRPWFLRVRVQPREVRRREVRVQAPRRRRPRHAP
jgi:hypothetical protein